MKSSEQRRMPRHRGKLPIFLKSGQGITRDFNVSGIYFETDRPFSAGQSVEFSIVLIHAYPDRPVRIRGWCEDNREVTGTKGSSDLEVRCWNRQHNCQSVSKLVSKKEVTRKKENGGLGVVSKYSYNLASMNNGCMDTELIKQQSILMSLFLNECQRRLCLTAEAKVIGYGGVSAVSRMIGISRGAISVGYDDYDHAKRKCYLRGGFARKVTGVSEP